MSPLYASEVGVDVGVGVFQGQVTKQTPLPLTLTKSIDVNKCESAMPYNLYYFQYQENQNNKQPRKLHSWLMTSSIEYWQLLLLANLFSHFSRIYSTCQ